MNEKNRNKPAREPAELAALLEAVAGRADRGAFTELFRHFAPRIKTYLMRSGTTASQADELSQEAMHMVWRKASYFDPSRAGAATWIFTIARNLRIDALRRERDPSALLPDASDAPMDPDQSDSILIAAERERKVREVLLALSEEQRRIVELSFFQDKPHGEISRELKIPLGTVKSRIRLAMLRLRQLLDEET